MKYAAAALLSVLLFGCEVVEVDRHRHVMEAMPGGKIFIERIEIEGGAILTKVWESTETITAIP